MVPILAALLSYDDAPDRDASRRADSSLHQAIAEATHNPILVATSIELRARITLNLGAAPYTDAVRATAVEQHRQLVAAIGDGRADDASDA